MQPDAPVFTAETYTLWETTFQQLNFEIKAGHDLHQMVMNYAYQNRLYLHRLEARWPRLSWLAISRSAQVVIGMSMLYLITLTLFLALDGVTRWAASLDQVYYSDGAPPSDLQQHRNYAQAQRDAGLLFGFFPLLILLAGTFTAWTVDRRQDLSGYRHFQRAVRLGAYHLVNTALFTEEITNHIEFLLTRRHEPGCEAVANLLINLQQSWIDDHSCLLATESAPSVSSQASDFSLDFSIPRQQWMLFLLFVTLKKMSHPLINTTATQRLRFLRTLLADNYFSITANQRKLGLWLILFFKPPEPTTDLNTRFYYRTNLEAYRRLTLEEKKTVLSAVLTDPQQGEQVSRELLSQKDSPQSNQKIMRHFIKTKKPDGVRLQLESQNYDTLLIHDPDVLRALLTP